MAAVDDSLRRALLALHKAVLAAEREHLGQVHGALSSAAFLQVVSDPVRYGWLQPLSRLILAFEEDEEERVPPDELLARTRELLLPPKEKTPDSGRALPRMPCIADTREPARSARSLRRSRSSSCR